MANKTLVIGIGSTGTAIAKDVVERIENEYGSLKRVPWVKLVAYETERLTDHPLAARQRGILRRMTLTEDEVRQLKTSQGAELEAGMGLSEWWDPNMAHRLKPDMAGAGNNRMIGKIIALTETNLTAYVDMLTAELGALSKLSPEEADKAMDTLPSGEPPAVRFGHQTYVYICGSLTGGTFSGAFIDYAYLTRQVIRENGYAAQVIGLIGLPHTSYPSIERKASAFAGLVELNHYYHGGAKYRQKFHHARFPHVAGLDGDKPFDEVFLGMPRPGEGGEHPEEELNDCFGEFIYVAGMSRAGDLLAAQLVNPTTQHSGDSHKDGSPQQFATFGVSVIEYPAAHLMRGCTAKLALAALQEWTHASLPEHQVAGIVAGELKLSDDALLERLTRDGASGGFSQVPEIVKRSVSEARSTKGDPLTLLDRGYQEVGKLYDPNSESGSPLLTRIDENYQLERKRLAEEVEGFFKTSLADVAKGPEYCVLVLQAAMKACADLAAEIENWRRMKSVSETSVRDCRDRIYDASNSLLLKALGWRKMAVQHWTEEYRKAASGYWNASMHVATESRKLDLLKTLHRLSPDDHEGVLDRIERRITDERWGMRQWIVKLQQQLEQDVEDCDTRPPKVNGVVLFEARKTLAQEYASLVAQARTTVADGPLQKRFPQSEAFAKAVVINRWDWLHTQLVAERSAFDAIVNAGQALTVKPVLETEKLGLQDLGRDFFAPLFRRSVLDKLMPFDDTKFKGEVDGDDAWSNIVSQIDEASKDAQPFLEINDAGLTLGKPSFGDPRLPSFAFYHGSTGADLKAVRLKEILKRSSAPAGPIANFDELDIPYRIVLIRARAVFPLQAIRGIDHLKKWYDDQESKLGGIHTNTKTLFREIWNDDKGIRPSAGEFLAALAIKAVDGGIPGDFVVHVKSKQLSERDYDLTLNHDLGDIAQTLLSPSRLSAKAQLQDAISRELDVRGAGEFVKALHDFTNALPTYKLVCGGRAVDHQTYVGLVTIYLQNRPDLRKRWMEQAVGHLQSNPEDYKELANCDLSKDATEEERAKSKYPITAYYCPACDNTLALKVEDVPVTCPRCNHILRTDL